MIRWLMKNIMKNDRFFYPWPILIYIANQTWTVLYTARHYAMYAFWDFEFIETTIMKKWPPHEHIPTTFLVTCKISVRRVIWTIWDHSPCSRSIWVGCTGTFRSPCTKRSHWNLTETVYYNVLMYKLESIFVSMLGVDGHVCESKYYWCMIQY